MNTHAKTHAVCSCRDMGRGGRKIAHGILPALALIFMPKCPACLAAYVAAFTGFTLSAGMAGGIRMALIILCAGWLLTVACVAIHHAIRRPARTNRFQATPQSS